MSESRPIGPSESVSHAEQIGYEPTDANVRNSIWTGIGIAVMTLLILIAVVLTTKWFQATTDQGRLPSPLAPARIFPPAPKVEVQPWTDFPKLRAHEEQVLNSYGVTRGEIHIPVDRAVDLIVPRLPMRSNSPETSVSAKPNAQTSVRSPGRAARQVKAQPNSRMEKSGNAK